MCARCASQKIVAESAYKHRTLGEVRHAVIVLLVSHVLAVPVDDRCVAELRVVQVHHHAVPLANLPEEGAAACRERGTPLHHVSGGSH